MLIFTGVGFGLAGQVSPLETVGFAVGIFVLQVLLSHVWLSSFRYGPVEGALRAVTNGTAPRWRVQAA
jgi:uncharacterized protein